MFEPEEAKQFAEEGEEWSDDPAKPSNVRTLQNEVWELKQYADLADSIKVNAKGEALKRALDRTFTVMRAHQWPEKALIFTESKRTQQYLFNLLSDHGYRGKMSLLSGDVGSPPRSAARWWRSSATARRSSSAPRPAPRGSTSSSATWW